MLTRELHERPNDLGVEGFHDLSSHRRSGHRPGMVAGQRKANRIRVVIEPPLPRSRIEGHIELDEGQIRDRALREERVRRRQRQVQRGQAVVGEHEARLRERYPEPGKAQKAVDTHRAAQVVVDHAQDDDLGMPRQNVSSISQVGLVDAIPVHAEVQDLHLGAECLLELMRPRLFVANLEPERERIPDDGDAPLRRQGGERHAGPRAP